MSHDEVPARRYLRPLSSTGEEPAWPPSPPIKAVRRLEAVRFGALKGKVPKRRTSQTEVGLGHMTAVEGGHEELEDVESWSTEGRRWGMLALLKAGWSPKDAAGHMGYNTKHPALRALPPSGVA